MIDFTYVMIAVIVLGILLICLSKPLFNKSMINVELLGIWLCFFSVGLMITVWTVYGLYEFIAFIIDMLL